MKFADDDDEDEINEDMPHIEHNPFLDDYFERMEMKFGAKYESLIRLALLVQGSVENFAAVYSLSNIEKLGVIGLASKMMGDRHLEEAEEEIEEILGEVQDENNE